MLAGKDYKDSVGPNIKILNTDYYLNVVFGDLFSVKWNEGEIWLY